MVGRRYMLYDVFTRTPLAGNPLAVVLQCEGLDTASMQAIAREFNLSETVFVLPPENARHRARIRIFTPDYEMPFAGHPTVGTAHVLAVTPVVHRIAPAPLVAVAEKAWTPAVESQV